MTAKSITALVMTAVALGLAACASPDWPMYRFNVFREGNQRDNTALSDPAQVPGLAIRWGFPARASEGGAFLASPIVVRNRVFVGSTSGRFYALDAATGNLLWQFPPTNQPALLGSCAGGGGYQTFGRYGVMSSATYFEGLVIFGAPDPAAESGMGSARLFALNESTGALVWASDVVAHVNGCNPGNASELHERIAYSAPLVFGRTVYVGTHNAGDDPIQNGKVMAVSVDTGHLVPSFSYASTSDRGGGVWNSPATDLAGVYFTTGNTRYDTQPPLSVNRGLSMLRIDPNTGGVVWQFQPVPYDLDDDPDWAAGVTIMLASCGILATSVQKDGWTYALDTETGSCRWQFPPTASGCIFPSGGAHDHGDTDYKRPGAAWGDVLVITTGGEALVHDGVTAGYGRLHALNACAGDELHRVRWIADVPHTSGGGYALGAATVTRGIVYVTTDQGHVVALGDPSIVPPAGYRCSDIDISGLIWQLRCVLAGYAIVPSPAVLADVALPDASSAAGLRNEMAIASGRLFVGTEGGHVYMLSASTGGGCSPVNACGGCTTLHEPPGLGCQDIATGKCGRFTCVGTDAVTCDTSRGLENVCGGCGFMPVPGSGFGRGDSCICNDPAQEQGTLVCSRDKNHLLCCPCTGPAPGCGPGSP